MGKAWYDDITTEDLEERVKALRGGQFRPYRPEISSGIKKTFSSEFLRDVEQEGDAEKVIKEYTRKLLARGGWKKKDAEAYLIRVLLRAQQEGKI